MTTDLTISFPVSVSEKKDLLEFADITAVIAGTSTYLAQIMTEQARVIGVADAELSRVADIVVSENTKLKSWAERMGEITRRANFADCEGSDNCGLTFTLNMTQSQIEAAEVASGEVEYLLSNAAGVFDFLQTGLSTGQFDPADPNIISLRELSWRALQAATENEGNQMTELSAALRTAIGRVS